MVTKIPKEFLYCYSCELVAELNEGELKDGNECKDCNGFNTSVHKVIKKSYLESIEKKSIERLDFLKRIEESKKEIFKLEKENYELTQALVKVILALAD